MRAANGAAVSTEQLTAAQQVNTIAAKAQAFALKAVNMALNIALFMAVVKGIQYLSQAISDYIHRA